MEVVLLGSTTQPVHAIGRALGRALDAVVVDGDRLRERSRARAEAPADPDGAWLEALRIELSAPRARPHVLVTCSASTVEERRVLRRRGACLVVLDARAPAGAPGRAEALGEADVDVRLAVGDGEPVEHVAARVLGSLVRHLGHGASPHGGDWPTPGDDVS